MTSNTQPLEYIQRTRRYYKALGYDNPYSWAHFDSVPFTKTNKPLTDCTVGIVTTAAPYQSDKGDQGPGAPYNAAAKFFAVYRLPVSPIPDLRISHIAIDRDHTSAEDPGSYLPLAALEETCKQGLIGEMAKHIFGLPTNRSQKQTVEVDCEALLAYVNEDEIDIVLLVPNCPVCHQSVSLAARTLEAAGVLTVVLGCAKDIVEHVGVPRFLFNDFPLGNAAGIPGDKHSQHEIIKAALALVESAKVSRTTVQSQFKWPGNGQWKFDYSNPDKLSDEEIRHKRAAFDSAKALANSSRQS